MRIPVESIRADSNSLRLGGYSVAAMRLFAAALEKNLQLSIKCIFTSPKLEDMAASAELISSTVHQAEEYVPLSLLPSTDKRSILDEVIGRKVFKDLGDIEDVFEATDYQIWTQGCGQLRTRGYNNYLIFHLKGQVDLQRLQESCQTLLDRHSDFVSRKEKLYQAVMKHLTPEFERYQLDDIEGVPESVIAGDLARPVNFAKPISRFLLAHQYV